MDKNIVWQKRKATYDDRCGVLGQKGLIVWFTGLSGSGKSTIAVDLEQELVNEKRAVYLLDGDNIRHGINSDLGFDEKDRNENIRRIAEIAALFHDAGIITLVSFISPFERMREFARNKVGSNDFIEVYVKADVKTCIKRDPKGLYQKQLSDFTGISSPYEIPKKPDVILDTDKTPLKQCVSIVLDAIHQRIHS